MAAIFVSSVIGNDGNAGTQKEAPKATLQSAMTAAGAGGFVYVSSLHAESGSASSLTSAGTAASPQIIVCVPDWGAATGSGAPSSLSTGGSFTTSSVLASFTGYAYIYGLTFADSSSTASTIRFGGGACWLYLERCEVSLTANSTNPTISIGQGTSGQQFVHFHNTAVRFANAGQRIRVGTRFRWTGTASAVLGTAPTSLFFTTQGTGDGTDAEVQGVDLSALGSGCAWVDVAASIGGRMAFSDCKAGSSVAFTTGAHPAQGGIEVTVVNTDSSDTNYRFFRQTFQATATQETTIVRSGGASDGATPVSRKVVTTANAKTITPFASMPIEYWNETVGSPITLSLPVLVDGFDPTNSEIWIEAEYLGTPGFPLGLFAHSRVSDPIFGTPATLPSHSSHGWTTTGLSDPRAFLPTVTFTPQEKGLVRLRVKIAKASTTVYYDPRVLDPSNRQYQSVSGFVNEAAPVLIVED